MARQPEDEDEGERTRDLGTRSIEPELKRPTTNMDERVRSGMLGVQEQLRGSGVFAIGETLRDSPLFRMAETLRDSPAFRMRAPVKFSPRLPVKFSPRDPERSPGFFYF